MFSTIGYLICIPFAALVRLFYNLTGSYGVSLILFTLVSIFPYQTLGIFTTEKSIIEEGVRYLAIIRFTYFFFAVTQILLATMRSVELVNIAFQLSIITFFINCGINYVLIYGHFGAPEMGAAGAAVGTLAARAIELLVLLFYIRKKETNLRLRLSDYFHPDKLLCRELNCSRKDVVCLEDSGGLYIRTGGKDSRSRIPIYMEAEIREPSS